MPTLSEKDFILLMSKIRPYVLGHNVIISLNLMRLGVPLFDFTNIVSKVFDCLSCSSLAIQTYSLLGNSYGPRIFSRHHTPVASYLSSLSKAAFRDHADCRLLSPTHSFVLFPFDSSISNHIFSSAFGSDSTFSFFLKKDFIWLNIGSELAETCTFLHHVEQANNLPSYYRAVTHFPVEIIPNEQSASHLINYEYYARNEGRSIDANWLPVQNHPSLVNCVISQKPYVSIYSLSDLSNVASKLLRADPSILFSDRL